MAGLVFASATLLVEQTALEGHESLVVALRCLLHTSDELRMKVKEHFITRGKEVRAYSSTAGCSWCGGPYLSVLAVLGGLELVRWLHKVQRVSGEPWDYVTELEAKHHQPARHIYSGTQNESGAMNATAKEALASVVSVLRYSQLCHLWDIFFLLFLLNADDQGQYQGINKVELVSTDLK